MSHGRHRLFDAKRRLGDWCQMDGPELDRWSRGTVYIFGRPTNMTALIPRFTLRHESRNQ